ncbi:MAG: tRNA (guanosine(37)-N1)-methyltransferase TrmD [Armatimonadetes bacterium]|nr:tRNA (guanosine(37)-N1)-methyltransferase TrmD [Armatimonadota bacterium]
MRIDIITLFPEVFSPLFSSIPGRAQKAGKVQVVLHNLRRWGTGKHRQVDDLPFGGGPGMVLAPGPLFRAVQEVREQAQEPGVVVYLTPQGESLRQALVEELAREPRLILLCGHYEGIDERVREAKVDREISVGDFVLSGGEIPAMALADAVIRLIPGVIREESAREESFSSGLLDHPHYTRPASFEGMPVPEVLLSGNHADIVRWRRRMAVERTARRRPELLAGADLTEPEKIEFLPGVEPGKE